MNDPPRTLIGFRTALLLYAVLASFAWLTLKGKFLDLALIVILALAVKTYVDHLRRRL